MESNSLCIESLWDEYCVDVSSKNGPISEIKPLVKQLTNFPHRFQHFFHEGVNAREYNTDIMSFERPLQLIIVTDNKVRFLVRRNGKTFKVHVNRDDTVGEIKLELNRKIAIAGPARSIIKFNGSILEDKTPLNRFANDTIFDLALEEIDNTRIVIFIDSMGVTRTNIDTHSDAKFREFYNLLDGMFDYDEMTIILGTQLLSIETQGDATLKQLGFTNMCHVSVEKRMEGGGPFDSIQLHTKEYVKSLVIAVSKLQIYLKD